MRDAITDLFLRIDDGPSEGFVDELRRRALAELTDGGTGWATVPITADRPDELSVTTTVVVRPVSDAPDRRGRRRRRVIVLVAAALAAAAIIIPVLRTDSRPEIDVIDDLTTTTNIPAPTVPPTVAQTSTVVAAPVTGFSRQFSGDVTTAGGQTFHVVADVSLPSPISTETELLNRNDLLLAPKVNIVVTSPNDPTASVSEAYAQIYFESDFTDCVLNAGAVQCDPFLLSQRVAAVTPTEVGNGLTFPSPDTPSAVGKIRVSANAVAFTRSRLDQGGLVHGIAIVVDASPADRPASQIASIGFSAKGEQVLTCANLPERCPTGTSPLTGGRTISTSGPLSEPLPQGQFPAGTFDVSEQAVGFSITTAGTWFVDSLVQNQAVLTRGVVDESQLIVLNTYEPDDEINTAAEAIANICPTGTIDFGPAVQTTLLGVAAVQVEGPVLDTCPRLGTLHGALGDVNSQLAIGTDYTVRIRAVDVDGKVVVMLGISPTSEWPAFSAELDATTLQRTS